MLTKVYREHEALIWLAGIYLAIIPIALWMLGAERFYHSPVAAPLNPLFILCFLGVSMFRMLADRDWTRRWPGALLIYLLVAMTADTFLSWKQALIRTVPFTWDHRLAAWDAMIHFGTPPWRIFTVAYAHPSLLWLVDRLYLLWVPIQLVVTFTVAWWPPSKLRTQYLLTHAALWVGVGTIGAAALGSVGPCFFDRFTGDTRFLPLMDRLRSQPLLALRIQDTLWRGYQGDTWTAMTGISAMPSMHIAVTMLVTLLAWESPLIFVRVVGIAFLIIIQAGSIILGWHYALDGYVAVAATLLIWVGIGRLTSGAGGRKAEASIRFSREWFLYWTTEILISWLMLILFLWFYVRGLPSAHP